MNRFRLAMSCVAIIFATGAAMVVHHTEDPPKVIQVRNVVVIDGDTIAMDHHLVRLADIDAPEIRQTCRRSDGREWKCGLRAREALVEILQDGDVNCVFLGTDRYARALGRCYVDGLEINRWLVARGWAMVYRPTSQRYVNEEDEARANGRGIWGGVMMAPWEFRRLSQ